MGWAKRNLATIAAVTGVALIALAIAAWYRGTPSPDLAKPAVVVTLPAIPQPFKSAVREASDLVPETVFTDPSLPADAPDIAINVGVECSLPDVASKKITPSHFEVYSTQKIPTGGFYFLLRLRGVKGRTIRLDFVGVPFEKWGNPFLQYSYTKDLNSFDSYESKDRPLPSWGPADAARPRTGDKPALPDTRGQKWHYVSECWRENERLCTKQTFTEDDVYITHRIPYTPGYNQNFFEGLKGNANVQVIKVGESSHGLPLDVAAIPGSGADGVKPCAVIYAREHADEQDGSWVAQGAIQFLISDDPEARRARAECSFLIVPLLDPDGALRAKHESIVSTFYPGFETQESEAFMRFFTSRVKGGGRIDVVLPLHNPAPISGFHVACPMMEPLADRYRRCTELHDVIRSHLLAAGYLVRLTPWTKGLLPPRLSGWLSSRYGALVLPYEVNSLAPKRQLNLSELRNLGRTVVLGIRQYLISAEGRDLVLEVDKVRLNPKPASMEQHLRSLGTIDSELLNKKTNSGSSSY